MANILFVNKESSILESIKRFLLEDGKSGFYASSISETYEIIEKEKIDIVFIDITNSDFIELLESIQKNDPQIVKIVISDFSHLSRVINNIRILNLHSFLLKPWKKNDLLDTITAAEEYSEFLKLQVKEKENLEQKNTIYRQIIHFKNDVGEYNKKDIDHLKNLNVILSEEYERYIQSLGCGYNENMLKNIKEAILVYSGSLPTFVEKFTIEDIFQKGSYLLHFDEKMKDVEFTKNLSLINSTIDRVSSYLKEMYHVGNIGISIYCDQTFNIEFRFDKNENVGNIKHFLDFLFKLFSQENIDSAYYIEEQVKVIFKF